MLRVRGDDAAGGISTAGISGDGGERQSRIGGRVCPPYVVNTGLMAHQHKVHELLSADELSGLEAFAREPGRSVDEVHEWLQARGYTMARSSSGRWLAEFKKQLMAERFGRSGDLARAIKDAVEGGRYEDIADGAARTLTQVIFEQSALLEQDGKVSSGDVMKWSIALRNLIGSKGEVAELREKQAAAMGEAEKAVKAGATAADVVMVIKKSLAIAA